MSSDYRTASLGERKLEYRVVRSEDATQPRIDVDIDGVTVVLPSDASDDPETLLSENESWVLEKAAKYDQYRSDAPDRVFEPGETFPYLGEDHELVVETRTKSVVDDGTIRLRQNAVDQSNVEQALRNFYRRQARAYLSERVDHYADELGVEPDELEIRNQRTRWGSCSSSGTVGLNWRLMMAPPDVIDYVVVHELAHLRETNHTKAFWSFVAEHDPEYVEHADWLEENSSRLVFSKSDL